MTPIYTHITTPIGQLLLLSDNQFLTGLYVTGQKYLPTIDASWQHKPEAEIFKTAEKQLLEYCNGQRTNLTIPYRFATGTLFQQQIWSSIANVPFGKTISYQELSLAAGRSAHSVRAVAAATGRNPLLLIIPCHRIIGSDGSLTGFAAGLDCKKTLLSLERNSYI